MEALWSGDKVAQPVAGDDRNTHVAHLFNQNYSGLCRLAYLIVGDRTQAEELVMDAFVRTLSSWATVRDPERADAYLRRVVVNLCRSRLRRRHREGRQRNLAGPQPDTSADPGDDVGLWQAVLALPAAQRCIVVLYYYEDRSIAEVATTMGCADGTVKSQLAKARSTLARRFNEEGDG